MRIAFAAVAFAVLFCGCASTRVRGEPTEADVESMSGGVSTAPAPSAGPMDAASLARENGLRYEDVGLSVLLASPSRDLLVRFYPESDALTLDGRRVPMGAPARREGSGLLVPAEGVAAVRRAAAAAGMRRAQQARLAAAAIAPAPPLPPRVASKPVPIVPATPTPRPAYAAAAGDPAWSPRVAERPWRWIVIHHSDDHEGCCAKYDRVHTAKGWEGCGYHFVIGNGTQSGDGAVEMSDRWSGQRQGAHAQDGKPGNLYNERGVGVVLVGDFEHASRPTSAQYASVVRLTRWLMARYGITPDRVLRHSDCKSTACPGRLFPWAAFQADVSAPASSPP